MEVVSPQDVDDPDVVGQVCSPEDEELLDSGEFDVKVVPEVVGYP